MFGAIAGRVYHAIALRDAGSNAGNERGRHRRPPRPNFTSGFAKNSGCPRRPLAGLDKSLLLPGELREQCIKLDHHLDGSNKDSILGAIAAWITEIGELDSSLGKDIARLKGCLTCDWDKLRPLGQGRQSTSGERLSAQRSTMSISSSITPETADGGRSRGKSSISNTINLQQLFR